MSILLKFLFFRVFYSIYFVDWFTMICSLQFYNYFLVYFTLDSRLLLFLRTITMLYTIYCSITVYFIIFTIFLKATDLQGLFTNLSDS